MTTKTIGWLVIFFSLMAIALVIPLSAEAQTLVPSQTPSLTPSITNTPNNEERSLLATVPPAFICGTIFNPCGSLPWNVPPMPTMVLPSPTIRPTLPSPTPIPVTATPTNSLTPTPSPTGTGTQPTVTAPSDYDAMKTMVNSMNESLSTIQAQSTQSIMVSGTPQSVLMSATELVGNMGGLFGTIKGIQQITQNKTYGAISFLIICFIFVILVSLATYFMPLILSLLKLLFQFIQAIKP